MSEVQPSAKLHMVKI